MLGAYTEITAGSLCLGWKEHVGVVLTIGERAIDSPVKPRTMEVLACEGI